MCLQGGCGFDPRRRPTCFQIDEAIARIELAIVKTQRYRVEMPKLDKLHLEETRTQPGCFPTPGLVLPLHLEPTDGAYSPIHAVTRKPRQMQQAHRTAAKVTLNSFGKPDER